jgi:putative heme-binding domain-containing protein
VAFLAARMAEVRQRTLDPGLCLDVVQAARTSLAPELQHAIEEYDASLDPRDPLAPYLVALHGGDAAKGRRVFATHPTAQCIKCHSVDGTGGRVGPDLSAIGARDRRYLLQAIITPGAVIARGFESTTLTLKDRTVVAGQILSEDAGHIVLAVNGAPRTIAKEAILNRPPPTTAMPPMAGTLQPEEIRDVIEFLVTRRDFTPDVPLGALIAVSATTGFGVVGRDQSCMSNPLRIAGRTYARGVGVHAPSRLAYEVPEGVHAFVARVGLDDEARGGLVGFEVRVDERSAWKSGPIPGGQLARAYVEIPPGARRIELLVDDGGNGTNNDHADWCDAGFVK